MTADGLLLVLQSTRPDGAGSSDLYVSSRDAVGATWGEPVDLGPPINTRYEEERAMISGDGLTLVFDSSRPGGAGKGDLWMSTRASRSDAWGEPANMGPVNTPEEEYAAALSSDGLVLILSTSHPGGSGGRDLFMSTRKSRGDSFGPAVNLGPVVNSAQDDDAPFLTDDASQLWFDSRRPGGFGGADIYMSRRVRKPALAEVDKNLPQPPALPKLKVSTREVLTSDAWKWGEVTNAGPLLNSPEMDNSPFLSADGRTLLFGSMRRGGKGNLDIWMSTRQSEIGRLGSACQPGRKYQRPEWDGSPSMTADGLTLLLTLTARSEAAIATSM